MLLFKLLLTANSFALTLTIPLAEHQNCADLYDPGNCGSNVQNGADISWYSEDGTAPVTTAIQSITESNLELRIRAVEATSSPSTTRKTTTSPTSTKTTAKTTSTSSHSTTTTMPCVNGSTYTITPTASPTALRRYIMNCGYDYTGGDMQLVYAASFQDCIKQCDSSKGCLDLSWLSNGYCYLKNVTMPMTTASAVLVARLSVSSTVSSTKTSTMTSSTKSSSSTSKSTSSASSLSSTSKSSSITTSNSSTMTTSSATTSRTSTSSSSLSTTTSSTLSISSSASSSGSSSTTSSSTSTTTTSTSTSASSTTTSLSSSSSISTTSGTTSGNTSTSSPSSVTSSATSAITTTTTSVVSSTSSVPAVTPGILPAPANWQALHGVAWNVTRMGVLGFDGALSSMNVNGDKCRTGSIGGRVIWNCGDMMCAPDWTKCGFSMGPGFYGTSSVMTIDTGGLTNIGNDVFMPAWSGDVQPSGNQTGFGMDMTNVVAVNNTHGVVFAWEIWRGASDGSIVDRGNAVASVTLGSKFPVATRKGPLLTDASAIQLGLLAVMADGGYIHLYSLPQSAGIITVTRVPASDAVFDISKYQTLNTAGQWIQGVPTPAQAIANYGMATDQPGGFGCAVYGSVFYNAYLKKYMLICNIYQNWTNMYASDTPIGPWSAEYGLLAGVTGYGSMAHPEFSPDGGKTIPWSQGPNAQFDVFSITFA